MKTLFLILGIFLVSACTSPAIFEKYEELPNETWNRYQIVELTAQIPDSGQYQVKLCLRHTTDYEMANLWCFITTRSQAAKELRDTVNLKIAEADGRWLGQGGSIKTIEQPLSHNPVLLPQGTVTFRIEQGMRIEELGGIKNVGLKIEPVNKEEEE